MTQMETDLVKKLRYDMRRAVIHFCDMCEIGEVTPLDQMSLIMGEMAYETARMARLIGLPKQDLFIALNRAWEAMEQYAPHPMEIMNGN